MSNLGCVVRNPVFAKLVSLGVFKLSLLTYVPLAVDIVDYRKNPFDTDEIRDIFIKIILDL